MTALPYAELIGDPVEHSLSPLIHDFWLEQLGLQAEHRRLQVKRGELAAYLEERRSDPDWRGCNVAMPLKLDALALADGASDRAIGIGAANLILPREGRLIAGNTDVCGASAAIERLIAAGAPMRTITILGSGGGARAIVMALHLLGISSVRIQSLDSGEAYKLAVQFGLGEEPRPFHMAIGGDGLINATPLGMTGSPPLDISLDGLAPNGWVFDLVTSPRPTDLVRRADERGLSTIAGVDMLVEQAADSFAHFHGVEAPRDRDDQLFASLER